MHNNQLMRSTIAPIIFFVALLSCNDKKAEPATVVNGKDDSSTRVRTERDLNPYSPVDISPMDMSYYPLEYPKLKMSKVTTGNPVARVLYSRPHLGGRTLFKDILKYDAPWRLGANEATEIEFYQDVSIRGQKIRAGRYVLYCIPHQESWSIVFNSNIETWGLEQDTTKDIARFTIPVTNTQRHIEYFTMVFEKTTAGANLVMAWDSVEARLPIEF